MMLDEIFYWGVVRNELRPFLLRVLCDEYLTGSTFSCTLVNTLVKYKLQV